MNRGSEWDGLKKVQELRKNNHLQNIMESGKDFHLLIDSTTDSITGLVGIMGYILRCDFTPRYVKLSKIFLKGVLSGGFSLSDFFRKRIVDLDA